MQDARAIQNRTLSCDWCGAVPLWLYLPAQHNGVFCEKCLTDVLNPLPTNEDDGGDGFDTVQRKLDAYLKQFPAEPVLCGRGRPRKVRTDEPLLPKRVRVKAQPRPPTEKCWKFFRRRDRIRIVREKAFAGIRLRVWRCLSDGISVEEALAEGAVAGLSESRMVATIRKLIVVYKVLTIERVA